ncbi:alpha/beta family hydrolase [Wenyingzhuangia marina]|uniref:KANL3/Tex30 alpha/beta hydrolase-like domain-containing protein n=1 Tax=Wenyingzhuangia marina TaxID=1195760 RepID=A0A1M5WZ50_9FLAO|nr:alpha/beta family hydrolase [Wenyingzhuangia marina]GGF82003.1 hypothetical protein GCM10011397_26220 [Wenyingzhuangia marina]SHH92183.1 hypothetical protein SAMN05444281_2735 [Wenyingzhuangia marina]
MTKPQQKKLFLIGRDNWLKDTDLKYILLNHLKKSGHKIIWEDPSEFFLFKVRQLEINYFYWVPEALKTINIRFIKILYGITHWDYFKYLKKRRNNSPEALKKNLKSILSKLNKDIIIISRSSGGRFASSVADELNIKHIICLSYPFQNPNNGVEPDRYIHLEHLKTPMTIFQGDKDEYGGLEVKDKYMLSPNINLQFVDADHDFNLSTKDWEKVLTQIDTIIKNV